MIKEFFMDIEVGLLRSICIAVSYARGLFCAGVMSRLRRSIWDTFDPDFLIRTAEPNILVGLSASRVDFLASTVYDLV